MMKHEIDYELAERIGATHYRVIDDCIGYLKVNGGAFDTYLHSQNEWVNSGITPLGVVHYGVKPIPPRPKVNVAYEKVAFNAAWQALKAFEDGEVFYTNGGANGYSKVESAPDVLRYMFRLYRRIERPVDWRESVAGYASLSHPYLVCKHLDMPSRELSYTVGDIELDENFLEMCRIALRATGELE